MVFANGQCCDLAGDGIVAEFSSTVSAVEAAVAEAAVPEWRDEVSYTLNPGEGIEVKLSMEEGQTARFFWTASGSVVNFDLHGDGSGQNIRYEQGRAVPEAEAVALQSGWPTPTSDISWRPLPRREYTKRSDYNALAVINQHTLTPNGWTHEQFNTKVLRNPDGSQVEIAREFGFNDYIKTTEVDFKPARDYWQATAGYWAKVRQRWDGFLGQAPGVHLKTKLDGMAMIMPLFTQAGEVQAGRTVGDSQIDAVFARWVEPATAR